MTMSPEVPEEDEEKGLIVAFIVNPIAGMGGRVGLKGTDNVLQEAIRRGAKPIAWKRAEEFLLSFSSLDGIQFIAPEGDMGGRILERVGIRKYVKLRGYPNYPNTTAEDTKRAVLEALEYNPEVIVFVGGDGTARDIISVCKEKPILGVPAGVKMYSSVFALSPIHAALVLEKFKGHRVTSEGVILDIDEDAFRRDELKLRVFGYALTPSSEFIQGSKEISHGEFDKEAIAEYFVDEIFNEEDLYVLGPGSTVYEIKRKILGKGTLLGVDVYSKERFMFDVGEKEILEALDNLRYKKAYIVVTIIGGQGILFGRGNQQISSEVIRRIGVENIIVVADSLKVKRVKKAYVDLDDRDLLKEFPEYLRIITGYGRFSVLPVVR